MLLAFLFIGVALVASGLKGTETQLAKLLEGTLTGDTSGLATAGVDTASNAQLQHSGFIVWMAAIILVGALGYIPGLEKPSKYLIGLVVVVIFLSHGGFFAQLFNAFPAFEQTGPSAPVPVPPVQSSSAGAGGSSSGSGGGASSAVSQGASTAASLAPLLLLALA